LVHIQYSSRPQSGKLDSDLVVGYTNSETMKISSLILIVIAVTLTNVETRGKKRMRLCITRTPTKIKRGDFGGGEIANIYQRWLKDHKREIVNGIGAVVTNPNLRANQVLYQVRNSRPNERIDHQDSENGVNRIAFQVGNTVQTQAHLDSTTIVPANTIGRPSDAKIAAAVYQALTYSGKDGYIYLVVLQEKVWDEKNGRSEYPHDNCAKGLLKN